MSKNLFLNEVPLDLFLKYYRNELEIYERKVTSSTAKSLFLVNDDIQTEILSDLPGEFMLPRNEELISLVDGLSYENEEFILNGIKYKKISSSIKDSPSGSQIIYGEGSFLLKNQFYIEEKNGNRKFNYKYATLTVNGKAVPTFTLFESLKKFVIEHSADLISVALFRQQTSQKTIREVYKIKLIDERIILFDDNDNSKEIGELRGLPPAIEYNTSSNSNLLRQKNFLDKLRIEELSEVSYVEGSGFYLLNKIVNDGRKSYTLFNVLFHFSGNATLNFNIESGRNSVEAYNSFIDDYNEENPGNEIDESKKITLIDNKQFTIPFSYNEFLFDDFKKFDNEIKVYGKEDNGKFYLCIDEIINSVDVKFERKDIQEVADEIKAEIEKSFEKDRNRILYLLREEKIISQDIENGEEEVYSIEIVYGKNTNKFIEKIVLNNSGKVIEDINSENIFNKSNIVRTNDINSKGKNNSYSYEKFFKDDPYVAENKLQESMKEKLNFMLTYMAESGISRIKPLVILGSDAHLQNYILAKSYSVNFSEEVEHFSVKKKSEVEKISPIDFGEIIKINKKESIKSNLSFPMPPSPSGNFIYLEDVFERLKEYKKFPLNKRIIDYKNRMNELNTVINNDGNKKEELGIATSYNKKLLVKGSERIFFKDIIINSIENFFNFNSYDYIKEILNEDEVIFDRTKAASNGDHPEEKNNFVEKYSLSLEKTNFFKTLNDLDKKEEYFNLEGTIC